jgi:hypothetical protein
VSFGLSIVGASRCGEEEAVRALLARSKGELLHMSGWEGGRRSCFGEVEM